MTATAGQRQEQLIEALLVRGEIFLPVQHPLLHRQTTMALFHTLYEQLNDKVGDGDLELGMRTLEGGWRITATLGSANDDEA